MSTHPKEQPAVWWAIGLVGTHLLVTLLHGAIHSVLAIPATAGDTLFRVVVITLLPVASVPLLRRRAKVGAVLLALAMGASLVYGAVNHFLIAGPDHIMAITALDGQMAFTITAILLFMLETGSTLLGIWIWLPHPPVQR